MKTNIESDYLKLLKDILDNGVNKDDRTGTGTRSIFGRQIRHDMQNGFPLLTTKRMPMKIIATELKWFLKGDTNIKYLVDNNFLFSELMTLTRLYDLHYHLNMAPCQNFHRQNLKSSLYLE